MLVSVPYLIIYTGRQGNFAQIIDRHDRIGPNEK